MTIRFSHKGNFAKTEKFLSRRRNYRQILTRYAEQGLTVLKSQTPVDTGESSDSWYYEIESKNSGYSIVWKNRHVTESGVPVVILLQYGHGTGSGGYVEGIDFINPAMRPLFDKIAEDLWKEASRE